MSNNDLFNINYGYQSEYIDILSQPEVFEHEFGYCLNPGNLLEYFSIYNEPVQSYNNFKTEEFSKDQKSEGIQEGLKPLTNTDLVYFSQGQISVPLLKENHRDSGNSDCKYKLSKEEDAFSEDRSYFEDVFGELKVEPKVESEIRAQVGELKVEPKVESKIGAQVESEIEHKIDMQVILRKEAESLQLDSDIESPEASNNKRNSRRPDLSGRLFFLNYGKKIISYILSLPLFRAQSDGTIVDSLLKNFSDLKELYEFQSWFSKNSTMKRKMMNKKGILSIFSRSQDQVNPHFLGLLRNFILFCLSENIIENYINHSHQFPKDEETLNQIKKSYISKANILKNKMI